MLAKVGQYTVGILFLALSFGIFFAEVWKFARHDSPVQLVLIAVGILFAALAGLVIDAPWTKARLDALEEAVRNAPSIPKG